MLNKSSPSIDHSYLTLSEPWRTPEVISSQLLYDDPILIICFWFWR